MLPVYNELISRIRSTGVVFIQETRLYEHYKQPVLPFPAFVKRLLRHFGIAVLILAVSLGVGMTGYHTLAGLGWVDSLLNASMILGGMGPVNALTSNSAKIFASLYALFAGMVFLAAAGVLIAPVAHRLLHRFHLDNSLKAGVHINDNRLKEA